MNIGVWLVPVMAGYWFLRVCHLTRRAFLSTTGYEFFFAAATAGGLLLSVARILALGAEWIAEATGFGWFGWERFAPFEYSGTLVLTVVLGLVAAVVVNVCISDDEAAARWAEKHESRFGWILRKSLEERLLVEVSTTSRKAYIGYVRTAAEWERDVALLPFLSGYRDPTTGRLRITTNYSQLPPQWLENYAVTIAMKEVVSISRFDPKVYNQLRQARASRDRGPAA